ncbi:indole-3-glycerol phosphate synthase TrpC [Dongia rigui]|uniref:Indole-3-glycerol phosphate synthase n=1 Tax=Dongia rigui TaxID=940149 RepID=A0ABU5E355_9PROT|nr:indole-3-glycerol phosphate synthase TrpC [Dongia rigui]MDY0874035.1 indole-3-glycerol phosphate synthase TrpC [Dongia rigui]
MSDVLAQICDDKRVHVTACEKAVPLAEIRRRAEESQRSDPPRGFAARLEKAVQDGHFGLIAEIKKASPSKGLIRADFDPATLAKAYKAGGATCLSVLTDMPYFQGADAYLQQARAAVDLPALRKDFMLVPYQIYEARALGADCILLIMACLDDAQAAELEALAFSLGMDVLVEVHDAAEMTRALQLKSRLLGVNNRNLKTLAIDLATTEQLAAMAPKDKLLVAESGLYTTTDLERMNRIGASIFLVGESLMRQADVTAATRALLGARTPLNSAA